MIIQCDSQGQLNPCYHQYCERLMLNYSGNNWQTTYGDILSLGVLGETLFFYFFALPNVTTNKGYVFVS